MCTSVHGKMGRRKRSRISWNREKLYQNRQVCHFIGFVVIAVVFLSVFIPRSGLNVEVIERSEVMGTMQTISVRISHNNFGTLNDVEVQFGEKGQVQPIGSMGPFSSVMITPPDTNNLNFDEVIVTANNGEVETIKSR